MSDPAPRRWDHYVRDMLTACELARSLEDIVSDTLEAAERLDSCVSS